MTFLATIHAKDYVLIAADKMEVAQLGSKFVCLRMDVDKIIDTGIGLMTGSGYVTLLDEVKSAVSEAKITHTDQILSIIQEKRSKISNSPYLVETQRLDLLTNTGWLFTYFTVFNNERTIRVAIYSPHVSEQYLSLVEENRCNAFFPSDATKATRELFMAFLKSGMVSCDGAASLEDTLSINSRLILRSMSDMSKVSSFVSESCDIGVVLLDGRTLIARNVSVHVPKISLEVINS